MKKIRLIISLILVFAALTLCASAAERDVDFENDLAADLKALGLFSGVSDTDFDLERAPSRVEALVMLVRLLGEEQTAKSGDFEMPFADVPEWAAPYVGYAYANGLTQGISATEFGMGDANAATYITFVLRALGYSDAEDDFSWANPYEFASNLGVLPSFVNTREFLRADAVSVSYSALSVDLKYKALSLAEKLMQKNVFTSAEYTANYVGTKITEKENEGKTKLSAEELFEKCSDSVFYVEVQSENGVPISSGSGFFITESGLGVTNWHVVNGADKILVTLQNGETHEVKAVWDYNPELDYAIIDIGGSGFTPLRCNPFPLKTASEVYAIGSPKGLQNTITQGIVSNPARVVERNRFIQTSAAISGGSSGGVLLNPYGEVVGITSNTYTDAQNLNFARPISAIALRKKTMGSNPAGTNWQYLRCEFDETEFSMLPGETLAIEFDGYYYTTNGGFPSYSVYSSNEDVVVGVPGIRKDVIYLYAKSEGTAMVMVSGGQGDKPALTVTVGEGEAVGEHVGVITNVDSLKLSRGAEKVLRAKSFAVNTEENSAGLSARSANSKIAKVEFLAGTGSIEVNGTLKKSRSTSLKLSIIGMSEGTTEIIITNDLTDEEVVIPITVGDCYADSYEYLTEYVYENGEYSPSQNGQLTYYSLKCVTTALNETATLLYYPSKKELHLQVVSYLGTAMYFDIIIGEEPVEILDKEYVGFNLLIPSLGIEVDGEILLDGFGDGENDNLSLATYSGPDAYRQRLLDTMPQSIVNMLCVFDTVFDEFFPGISVSDFGFTDVDYAAYGIE